MSRVPSASTTRGQAAIQLGQTSPKIPPAGWTRHAGGLEVMEQPFAPVRGPVAAERRTARVEACVFGEQALKGCLGLAEGRRPGGDGGSCRRATREHAEPPQHRAGAQGRVDVIRWAKDDVRRGCFSEQPRLVGGGLSHAGVVDPGAHADLHLACLAGVIDTGEAQAERVVVCQEKSALRPARRRSASRTRRSGTSDSARSARWRRSQLGCGTGGRRRPSPVPARPAWWGCGQRGRPTRHPPGRAPCAGCRRWSRARTWRSGRDCAGSRRG